jgi:uncharacterized protein YbbC (DUF1343 family)/CubicO group peptidase (beta-lactamase class C family)
MAFCLAPAALGAATFAGGPALDAVIEKAIVAGEIPGAVVVIGHNGAIVYEKAYGSRAIVPQSEAMTFDTIFDVASLTKVTATTPSVMRLLEQGKIRLDDKVTAYLPEFQGGRSDITVRQLLTHYSGMRPDVDLKPEWSGYQTGIDKALGDKPINLPNQKFTYSDINFVLLGEIVRRVSGKGLDEFARDEVFKPLGMNDSSFRPPDASLPRIAPTEITPPSTLPLRGVVHDPTARFMGGVAGHAGLFSTAQDLAKYAQMMLNLGEWNGRRVFSPLTIRTFTSPQSPPGAAAVRGLGWDIDSPYSGNRGDLFPLGSYGHTGFTGTSIWIDPFTQSYVILLTNAVHPHHKGAVTGLRSRVATIAAAGLGVDVRPSMLPALYSVRRAATPPAPRNLETMTGLDVLAASGFDRLQGRRVGLITNHTGLSREGKRNIDLMRAAGVDLRAIFSPEHGITGKQDQEKIANTRDAATGLPVYSLYAGENRKPAEESLKDIDTLVFDIQDVGARFYTYACTMANAMEVAAQKGLRFVVLDRPNPITGTRVEGPVLDPDLKSFVGCMAIPLRHGMTLGELAQFYNQDLAPKADLEVIRMRNWQRSAWWDETGLIWVDPSPNMRSLNAALLYPGIAMLEYSKNYSVGRGTDAPFEQVGADWIKGSELAAALNALELPGIRVYAVRFSPGASNFSGRTIEGVRFVIVDREAFDSVRFGLELAAILRKLYPGKIDFQANERLIGARKTVDGLIASERVAEILRTLAPEIATFQVRRSQVLLY